VVGLWCRRADVPGEKTLAFDLDFFARQLNTKVQSAPGAVALGRAFLAEAQEAHWEWFDRLVRAVKRRQMENLDLDTLAEDLPPDLKVGGGVLTGYAEVFPWVDPFTFACDGADWFVDDQYCMEPGCGCTQAGLTFFRAPAALTTPRAPLRSHAFLHFDYRTNKTEVVETRPGGPGPEALMHALRTARTDLAEVLRGRHGRLRQLGRRLVSRAGRRSRAGRSIAAGDRAELENASPPAPTPFARPAPKVGRNDPCPCGSGKKSKKCCGAG
jgi:hypothetical protein